MNKKLTKKQEYFLTQLKAMVQESEGRRPSYQEIANKLQLSNHIAVKQYMDTLEKKGVILRSKRMPRYFEIKDDSSVSQSILNLKFSSKTEATGLAIPTQYTVQYQKKSLFPELIVDGSIASIKDKKLNFCAESLPFLASHEPIITDACIKELHFSRIPDYFTKVKINNPSDINAIYNYSDNEILYTFTNGTSSKLNPVVFNTNSAQLSISFNNERFNKLRDIINGTNNSGVTEQNFFSLTNGRMFYSFTQHIIRNPGDYEICVLWALTGFPVLTADKKIRNNITNNGGEVHFIRKE